MQSIKNNIDRRDSEPFANDEQTIAGSKSPPHGSVGKGGPAEIAERDQQLGDVLSRHLHDLQNALWPIGIQAEVSATDETCPSGVREIWERVGHDVHEAMTIASKMSEVLNAHLRSRIPRCAVPAALPSRPSVKDRTVRQKASDPPGPGAARSSSTPQMRILCADGDANVLGALSRFLKHLGHEVDPCRSGTDALALIAAGRYDVVMTSFELAGADGRAVTREVRKCGSTPVIWLTGEDHSEGAAPAAETDGPNWVLPKPVSLNALRHALGAVAGRGQPATAD